MMGGYRLPVNVPETVPSTVLDDMASRQGLVYVHLGTVGLFVVTVMLSTKVLLGRGVG